MLFSYLEERLYIAARLTACPNFSLAACKGNKISYPAAARKISTGGKSKRTLKKKDRLTQPKRKSPFRL